MHGLHGWLGWNDDPTFDAMVTDEPARSAPHSVEVNGATDIVHDYCTAGVGTWSYSAWQYLPTEFTSFGNDREAGTYFIMLNSYDIKGPDRWSVQMQFDSRDGLLKTLHGDGVNSIDVPYVTDRWVKIEAIIDLDDDWTQIYYDDELVTEYTWTGGVYGDGGGALAIAIVDLWARGSSSVFYDDLVLERVTCPADVDDNGSVGFSDLLAILAAWGTCGGCPEDVDGDGFVAFSDLLIVLANWGPCP